MAKAGKLFEVSSFKIIHLGMKPVSGGSPPNENKTKGIKYVNVGFLTQEVASELIVVVLFNLKIKNNDEVIMM